MTGYKKGAKSVVELSENRLFKREYSSIFRAIANYYVPRNSIINQREERRSKARKNIFDFLLNFAMRSDEKIYSFYLDITGNTKKHSHTMPDRSYIHSNCGMTVGHSYSAICLSAGNSWALPVAMERIPFRKNKFEFSVSQITPIVEKLPRSALVVCIGDSAYCCNKFIHPMNEHKHVVTITRVRSNKVIFGRYVDLKQGVGRKKKYGKKYALTKDFLPTPDLNNSFEERTKRGKSQKIKLSLFKGYICRGSKGYTMSEIPMNFVKVEVYNENGTRKYARDLWLEVVGERRNEISLVQAYLQYKGRFDIEHLFKFGKSKLLMDKFQTTNPQKDEDFMLFGIIAYHLLHYSRNLLHNTRLRKWENKRKVNLNSPCQVYRAAAESNLFDRLDSSTLKKRGIPTRKNIRKIFTSSEACPILRKETDPYKIEIAIKSRFKNIVRITKTSINVNRNFREVFKKQIVTKSQNICSKMWPQGG